jgi:hypothetical protein
MSLKSKRTRKTKAIQAKKTQSMKDLEEMPVVPRINFHDDPTTMITKTDGNCQWGHGRPNTREGCEKKVDICCAWRVTELTEPIQDASIIGMIQLKPRSTANTDCQSSLQKIADHLKPLFENKQLECQDIDVYYGPQDIQRAQLLCCNVNQIGTRIVLTCLASGYMQSRSFANLIRAILTRELYVLKEWIDGTANPYDPETMAVSSSACQYQYNNIMNETTFDVAPSKIKPGKIASDTLLMK